MLTSAQNILLHDYLRGTGRTITAAQALSKYGIRNLRARMSELRSAGLVVETSLTRDGRTKYAIAEKTRNGSRNSLTSN